MNEKTSGIYTRKFMRRKRQRERERGKSGEKIYCTIEKVRCLPVPRMHQRERDGVGIREGCVYVSKR